MRYAFIKVHQSQHSVRRMCKVMQVHPSGCYAWKREPQSQRAQDDQRLTGLLKQAWLDAGAAAVLDEALTGIALARCRADTLG